MMSGKMCTKLRVHDVLEQRLAVYEKGKISHYWVVVLLHTFNCNTQEAKTRRSLRPVWFIKQIPGQSGLHREILS